MQRGISVVRLLVQEFGAKGFGEVVVGAEFRGVV
jgi:hypothetical protein